MAVEKLICGDCNGITEFHKGLRGNIIVSTILWSLIIPGIFYSIWRRSAPKKVCQYCGSNFLLPADSPYIRDMLKPITKK